MPQRDAMDPVGSAARPPAAGHPGPRSLLSLIKKIEKTISCEVSPGWYFNCYLPHEQPGAELMAEKRRLDADAIADRIQAYLAAHPKAADTLDGISRWWLREEGVEIWPDQVLEALRMLQKRGVICAYTAPGGNRIYAQCPSRRS